MTPLALFLMALLAAPEPRAEAGLKIEYLWPKGAPGAIDGSEASKPSVAVHPPASGKNTGAAVVVLDYRHAPAYRHPAPMLDAQRALRWVRANAVRYGIDARRVGVLGFSAGGHLAATVATHHDEGDPAAPDSVDRHSCRPDFQILIYPVITMDTLNRGVSRKNLLGPNPSGELLGFLSLEKHVTASTPPAFLVHGKDDATVPVQNSRLYYDALKSAGVPATLELYDHGPHGFGLADGSGGGLVDAELAKWPGLAAKWLKALGFLAL